MNYVSSATVVNVIHHSEQVREYILKLDKVFKYRPGSFVQLTLEEVTASDVWPESRTFSIASYKNDLMHFIIKNEGKYTNRIFNELEEGKICTIKYPYGSLYQRNKDDEKHLFIASGLGITPFLGLIDYFEYVGKCTNVSMYYSVKYEKDLLHHIKVKKLLQDQFVIFITKEYSDYFQNRHIAIEDVKSVSEIDTNIYISGSKDFNAYFKKELLKLGYNKIYMDEWE